jgi:hypothetical protein
VYDDDDDVYLEYYSGKGFHINYSVYMSYVKHINPANEACICMWVQVIDNLACIDKLSSLSDEVGRYMYIYIYVFVFIYIYIWL